MGIINNNIYRTTNQFGGYANYINGFLNNLYKISLESYSRRYVQNNPTGTYEIDIRKIQESLGYIDDYLFYYYQNFDQEIFLSVYKNLVDNLLAITVFPPQRRGLYGQYVSSEKTLYINPQLRPSKVLSADERTRLYICHELGHIQNSIWLDKLLLILNNIRCSDEYKQLMYDGFSLLDEATTQDRAENITYYFSHKVRPHMTSSSTRLFDRKPFETNFDYYGEFQMPTIDFARTLRGIGKLDDNEQVMTEFDKRALSADFASRIFDEYINDGQINNLYYMLIRLGIIKNASYAVFGQSDAKYLRQSLIALEQYKQLVDEMRDYRDPVVKK